MKTNTDDQKQIMMDRYLGCLLGGAAGDALGYPIEFQTEQQIKKTYGSCGIQTLSQAGTPALVSDDTQMSLFAVNAILFADKHQVNLRDALWTAYQEWLGTQGDTSRMNDPKHPLMWIYHDPRLHFRRAPGSTCLSAIRTGNVGGTIYQPINNSKGCGTVMRAAPFGLAGFFDPQYMTGEDIIGVHKMAVCDAALTHGHIYAWASSSLLAQIIFYIVKKRPDHNYPLQDAVCYVEVPYAPEVHQLLLTAVDLAVNQHISDIDSIHLLGKGWVAEEALAIAVFCAIRYQNDFSSALRAAVNHGGDSDSTGAICGNILGAWLGNKIIEQSLDFKNLELKDLITQMAENLFELS